MPASWGTDQSHQFSACVVLVLSVGLSAAAFGAETPPDRAVLQRSKVELRYVEYEFAIEVDDSGLPKLNWQRFRAKPPKVVVRAQDAIVLENSAFRATILPQMGRVHSLIDQSSGKEQLWVNPIAIPIPAHNDTGFWITWGGIECVLPRGEHGTSHALTWNAIIDEDSQANKAVKTSCVEPITGLEHSVTYRVSSDKPYLETLVEIRNTGTDDVQFSHWTTALLAPGGRGEVTPCTELIVPADRFLAADRPFNHWMTGLLGPTDRSPLRLVTNWKDIGDLMATPLTKPYYAAYSHEGDAAVVRVLDLKYTPGFNIWTWGYPPSESRQKEYTAAPQNRGYVEFWSGTAKNFSDDARTSIRSGQTLSWVERTYLIAGLKGATSIPSEIERRCGISPSK